MYAEYVLYVCSECVECLLRVLYISTCVLFVCCMSVVSVKCNRQLGRERGGEGRRGGGGSFRSTARRAL